MAAPTPVTVVCGFLGAGKTTLLNRLLAEPMGRRLAVLVNDFGAINIDAELVESVDETGIALTNGCICCSIRDDLVLALLQLRQNRPDVDHVIIEASGISDPVGIAEALFQPEVSPQVRVDSLVTVADAAAYREMEFHDAELVLQQARIADLVLLNKCDIAAPESRQLLERDIADMAPAARIYLTAQAEIPAAILFEPRTLTAGLAALQDHGHTHDDRAHDHVTDALPHGFSMRAWQITGPLQLEAFTNFVRDLPRGIYRAKGILNFAHLPAYRTIFHLVGKRSSLEGDRRWREQPASRLVLIGRIETGEWERIDRALQACILDMPKVAAGMMP